MLDWFLELLKNPEFQIFVATYAGTKLLDSAGSKIKQLKDLSKKGTPEWQFITCLENAFFTTETQLGWKHQTEAIYESFEDALLSHQGFFTITSLKEIFEAVVGHPVSEADLEAWVGNFKRELAMGDYPALLRFLSIDHMLQPQAFAQANQTSYTFTSSASIFDNPEIICRDEFIDELLQMFTPGHNRIQITGMGGLGKTEVLKKVYAKLANAKEKSKFDHIAYLQFNGEISDDIEAQIDHPNQYKGLEGVNASNLFLHDICSDKNVLLCIDDVRTTAELIKAEHPCIRYLNSLGAKVLLASRVIFPNFEEAPLGLLSTDSCIAIFEKGYGRSVTKQDELDVLKAIIETRAGNHTLVVSRLSSMASEYEWSVLDLSNKLSEQNFNIAIDISDDTKFQNEINKLYLVDEKLTESEKTILTAFSVFPAIPLTYDLCVDWLHEDAKLDSDLCALALNKLSKKTWLIKQNGSNVATPFYSMHSIVNAAVQSQLRKEKPSLPHMIDRITSKIFDLINSYELSRASELIPFASSTILTVVFEVEVYFTLSCLIANFYYKTANYKAAEAWNRFTLNNLTKELGSEHTFVALTENNLASVLHEQGNLETALHLYLTSLDVLEKQPEKDLHTISTIESNIASIYSAQDNLVLSLEWFNRCLPLNELKNDDEKRSAAETFCNIAGIYHKKGELSVARENFEKSLSIFTELNLTIHASFAQLLNNFAMLCMSENKEDEGLVLLLKALDVREKTFGSNHPDTASTCNNISTIYEKKGDYENALSWIQKAQNVCDTVYGRQHIHTAITYNNIGRILRKQGEFELSLEWHNEALDIVEHTSDRNPFLMGAICSYIADVYFDQTKYNDALNWYIRANTMLELSPRQDTQVKIHVNDRIQEIKLMLCNSD